MDNSSFIFKGYKTDFSKGEMFFNYAILLRDKSIDFTEKISFPLVTNKIPETLLKSLLDNVMLILGISYWKLYCPQNIVIKPFFLSKEQAEFWNIVYTKGMGEFFYKNKIDFRGLISFPYRKQVFASPTSFSRKDRALLGLGGGKDSIVAGEMLKEKNMEFGAFMVGSSTIQTDVARAMDKTLIIINRGLDPKLFELNKRKDIYNGHIPVSAIYAFLGLMASVFYDYNKVVVGNEKSANYGNVKYLGEAVNHQWSKSGEFEKIFREYVQKFITPDITYSSPLRNMNELEVTKEFVKYPKYFKVFSSCNANFRISAPLRSNELRRGKWCGKCPKCLFVFTLLAAFLPKKEVLDIFGKNLFEDEDLLPLLKELLGLKDIKPFECVGTPEEMNEALLEIAKKGEFQETSLMNFFLNK